MGKQPVDLARVQRGEIDQIRHPDRAPADLVLVGRADAAARGADLAPCRRPPRATVELAVNGRISGAFSAMRRFRA
jgi:hypothetical protein